MTILSLPIAFFLIVQSAAVAAPAFAKQQSTQTPAQLTAKTAKVKAQVRQRGTGDNSRVRVTLRDASRLKGFISEIGDDSFSVNDKKWDQTKIISYSDVARIQGPGLSKGAKIGIGVAISVGAAALTLGIIYAIATHGPSGPI